LGISKTRFGKGANFPFQETGLYTGGIWEPTWEDFNGGRENQNYQSNLREEKFLFRVSGPTKLPRGRESQVMIFDLGYGTQGGGLHYRPSIDIKYTIPPTTLTLESSNVMTIS